MRQKASEHNIEAKLRELTASRAATVAEIIALEKQGIEAREAGPADDVEAKARALLNGSGECLPVPVGRPEIRLHELRSQLPIVDHALNLAERIARAERGERARQRAAESADEWKRLQRSRVLLVAELIRTNTEIEELKTKITGGEPGPNLLLDGYSLRLGGWKDAIGNGHWFREYLKDPEF